MPSLFKALRKPETRSTPGALTLDQWAQYFTYGGHQYGIGGGGSITSKQDEIGGDFGSLVQGAYRTNGVVFACILARMLLFSEARFQFRRRRNGRPGELFGTPALGPLEAPWAGATTGDLMRRAIQDADMDGNFFAVRVGKRVLRLRPDWVTIVAGSQMLPDAAGWAPDTEVIGYVYHPGGRYSGEQPVAYLAEQVAHFAPIPDPVCNFRGLSWLTPVVGEIMGDKAATEHKLKFFENGATPNLMVTIGGPDTPAGVMTREEFGRWIELFEQEHTGISNAYKTLWLSGGSTATVVGSDMKQIDFKATQGAGETRIATAAGVPPVIVGLSEGLQAATYSNYAQARRRFADMTIRPLWRDIAGSLARIVDVPSDAELWYDDRDIPALQEDEKDAAEIAFTQAQTIRQLIDAGYTPESVVLAVESENWSLLDHTGLFSVQLQEPGSQQPDPLSGRSVDRIEASRVLAALLPPIDQQ